MLARHPKCLAAALAINLAFLLSGSSKALASTSPGRESAKSTAPGRGIAPQEEGGGLRQPSSSVWLDCDTEFVGDGYCDRHLNTADCDFDGGDCCACTCKDDIFLCGGNYYCLDPNAACVNDDDESVEFRVEKYAVQGGDVTGTSTSSARGALVGLSTAAASVAMGVGVVAAIGVSFILP